MKKRFLLVAAVLLFFSLWGMRPVFNQQLWSAHDIWHNVARHYHYVESLKDGQFLPTWISSLANGYGYPLFHFSYHLPWLLGSAFVFSGLSIFESMRLLFVVSFLLSGFTCYLFLKYVFKDDLAALIGAIVYLWAPYHFLTVYVSAAIGTAFVFIFLPLLFLGTVLIHKRKTYGGMALIAASVCCLVLSHLMTVVMVMPFFLLWSCLFILSRRKEKHQFYQDITFLFQVAGGVVIGLLAASFYILPMLTYLSEIKAFQPGVGFDAIFQSNFVSLKQLIYSKWGFGPIISNAKDGEISFQIGIAQWLGVIGSIPVLLLFGKRVKKVAFLFSSLILFLCSIFLMTDVSKKLWIFASHFVTLDYPFRLLIISVFSGSSIVAWIVAHFSHHFIQELEKKYENLKSLKKISIKRIPIFTLFECLKAKNFFQVGIATIFIIIAVYTNRNHVRVNMYTDFPLDIYVLSEITTNTFHEYLPIDADIELLDIDRPWSPIISSASYSAEVRSRSSNQVNIDFTLNTDGLVSFGQFAFPGQKMYLNGNHVTYTKDDRGLISLPLVPGEYQAVIKFEDTQVVSFGKAASVLGWFLIVLLVGFEYISHKKNDSRKATDNGIKKEIT